MLCIERTSYGQRQRKQSTDKYIRLSDRLGDLVDVLGTSRDSQRHLHDHFGVPIAE